jgi:hypothetical protein
MASETQPSNWNLKELMGLWRAECGRDWMIDEKTSGRLYGVCLAAVYGTLITGVILELWHSLRIASVVLIFVALWIAFYFTGVWVAVERPAELNGKLPLSGRERRRRKKEFYDWLASQRRR